MNFKATKTPLLIAALATVVTLTSFIPASAKEYWASASYNSAQVITADLRVDDHDTGAEVIDAKFKKFRSHRSYRSHRSHRSFRGKSSFNRNRNFRGREFNRGHRFNGRNDFRRHDNRRNIIIKKRF